MRHQEAKKAIEELDVALKKTPKETSALERLLEQAKDEIEDLTPEAARDLIETLQREAEEFETEHPRVTALINQVMHALSGLGI